MKILGITSRLPWPLTDGARIVMYQGLRGLASRGHDVHLVTLEEGTGRLDLGDLPEFATLHVHRYVPESRVLGALQSILHPRPYTHLRKDYPEVHAILDRLIDEVDFDVVYADQSHTAHYASRVARKWDLPYLFRSHNVEHEIWRRHLERSRWSPIRPWLASQYRKWKRFEIEEMGYADLCAAITDRDAETIRGLLPELEVMTIPAAVDLDRFGFVDASQRDSATLLLLGGMGWAPNRDAAIWFSNEILPRVRREIPEVVTVIVGSDPPYKELPSTDEQFRVEGYVDDILPYYRSATVGVIPLRVGGGMRVKIVEMMASGLPCVSTPIGAEGNRAVGGEHFVEGSDAAEIAHGIVRLLKSRDSREEVAVAARRFVEETYGFDAVAELYERAVRRAVEIHREKGGPRG